MLPFVIGTLASVLLPAIIDAFRSGKSPEEAAKIIAPHRKEIIDRLVGSGMNGPAAEAMADESLKSELAQAQLPEPMNPWLQGALMLGGGIAGYKGGVKLQSMRNNRMKPLSMEGDPSAMSKDVAPAQQTSTNAAQTGKGAKAPLGDEAEAVHNVAEEVAEPPHNIRGLLKPPMETPAYNRLAEPFPAVTQPTAQPTMQEIGLAQSGGMMFSPGTKRTPFPRGR